MPKKATETHNFAASYPEQAKTWHPYRNGSLAPSHVAPKSNKKVWWQCVEGHEWEAVVANRIKSGCPECYFDNRRVSGIDKLSQIPELVAQVSTSNEDLSKILDTYPGSPRSIVWQCSICNLEWENSIRNRVIRGQSCPYCTQKRISHELIFKNHPFLLNEWDYEKNSVSPYEVRSNERVFWKCPRNHQWSTTFSQRVHQKTGCSKCVAKISRPNLRIYAELKFFTETQIVLSGKVGRYEVDILLPEKKVIIEYDGFPYHHPSFSANAKSRDETKTKSLIDAGFAVIRLREKRLPCLEVGLTISCEEEFIYKCMPELLAVLSSLDVIRTSRASEISVYRSGEYLNENLYLESLMEYKKVRIEYSLAATHPHLIKYWSLRNKDQPTDVSPGSHEKRWWNCDNGHETLVQIKQKALLNTGCGKCSGRHASKGNNLKECHPAIASEFDIGANGGKRPEDFTPQSNERVWWKCTCGHQWQTTINNRTKLKGTGCAKCKKRVVTNIHNLAVKSPELANWLDSKRTGKEATEIMPSAAMVAFWRCPNGHSWERSVDHQVRAGLYCPQCRRATGAA